MKKNLSPVLLAVAVVGSFGLPNLASAQSNLNGDDGIAASPKVRQMLDERKAMYAAEANSAASPVIVVYPGVNPQTNLAASPKLREMLGQRQFVAGPLNTEIPSAPGYTPNRTDGIAASPKLQQQMQDRGTTFMVAPVK